MSKKQWGFLSRKGGDIVCIQANISDVEVCKTYAQEKYQHCYCQQMVYFKNCIRHLNSDDDTKRGEKRLL